MSIQIKTGHSRLRIWQLPGFALPRFSRKRWALRLGGTLLLAIFIWRLNLNFGRVWTVLSQENPWLLALAAALIFPILGLKTERWRIILADLKINIPFGPAWRLYALGLCLGSFTPGQAGDAVKAWKLQEMGYKLGPGLLAVVLDRLFDVIVLLVLAIGGLLWLGPGFEEQLPVLLVLLAGVGLSLLLLGAPGLRERAARLAFKVAARKRTAGAEDGEPLAQSLSLCRPLLLTLGTAGLALARTWLLAAALGLNLGFPEVLAASSLATVAGLLPVSVSGIGARDLALIGILGRLSYSAESAICLSVLLLLMNFVNLVAGYALWVLNPGRRPLQEKMQEAAPAGGNF